MSDGTSFRPSRMTHPLPATSPPNPRCRRARPCPGTIGPRIRAISTTRVKSGTALGDPPWIRRGWWPLHRQTRGGASAPASRRQEAAGRADLSVSFRQERTHNGMTLPRPYRARETWLHNARPCPDPTFAVNWTRLGSTGLDSTRSVSNPACGGLLPRNFKKKWAAPQCVRSKCRRDPMIRPPQEARAFSGWALAPLPFSPLSSPSLPPLLSPEKQGTNHESKASRQRGRIGSVQVVRGRDRREGEGEGDLGRWAIQGSGQALPQNSSGRFEDLGGICRPHAWATRRNSPLPAWDDPVPAVTHHRQR